MYTSYDTAWPQWMSYHTAPQSGSLFYRFIRYSKLDSLSRLDLASTGFSQRWVDKSIPYYMWKAILPPDLVGKQLSIVANTTAGNIQLNEAKSQYELQTLMSPCFFVDNTTLYIQNLDMVNAIVQPDQAGNIVIENQLEWSECFYLDTDHYARLEYPKTFVGRTSLTHIYYHDKNLFNALQNGIILHINNKYTVPAICLPIKTFIDGMAEAAYITRNKYEDTNNLLARVKTRYCVGKGTTLLSLTYNIAIDLDCVKLLTWVPTGELLLPINTTVVQIPALPERDIVVEPRAYMPRYNTISLQKYHEQAPLYLFTYGDSNLISINNALLCHGDDSLFPYTFELLGALMQNITILPYTFGSSNVITSANTSPVGGVLVWYTIQNYTTATSGNYAIKLVPTANCTEEQKDVFITSGIKSRTLTSEIINEYDSFSQNMLINSIQEKVPITIGYTTWEKETWFGESTMMPMMSFVGNNLE